MTKIDGLSPPAGRPVEAAQTAAVSRAGGDRSQPVAATAAADSVRLTGQATGLQAAMDAQLGQPAGIDMARVNAVRDALANGTYRIDPQEIASRLVALERQLGG